MLERPTPGTGEGSSSLPAARSFRILVLAQEKTVCESIGAFLREFEWTEDTVHATEPQTALRAVRRTAADTVVTLLPVTGLDPIDFARSLQELDRPSRLVFTGLEADVDLAASLVEFGVDGLCFEDGSRVDLAAALGAVSRNEMLLPPKVVARVASRLQELGRILRSTEFDPDAYDTLTERQREVLAHLGRGLTNREIAARLGIQVGTVKTHVHHVLDKLDVRTREAAAEYLQVLETPRRRGESPER